MFSEDFAGFQHFESFFGLWVHFWTLGLFFGLRVSFWVFGPFFGFSGFSGFALRSGAIEREVWAQVNTLSVLARPIRCFVYVYVM